MIFLVLILVAFACAYIASKGGLRNVARSRKYKSGTGWCVWRWTDVQSEYILRLHVIKTPWCAICLHWINKPDEEPWLHDHPVTFLSLILRGGYAEHRGGYYNTPTFKVHRWFNFVHASEGDAHRICFVRKNTLTLCFMGPKTRNWGFHMPFGWVGWQEYYARLKAGENMRGNTLSQFEQRIAPQLDQMTRCFMEVNGVLPRKLEDEDKREIDTAPADEFNAEEITTEIQRG